MKYVMVPRTSATELWHRTGMRGIDTRNGTLVCEPQRLTDAEYNSLMRDIRRAFEPPKPPRCPHCGPVILCLKCAPC